MQNQMQLKTFIFKKKNIFTLFNIGAMFTYWSEKNHAVSKILKSKINRVIFSVNDPDKRVNGNGKKILIKNKLEVNLRLLKKKLKILLSWIFS